MKERFKKIWASKWLRWGIVIIVIAIVAKLLFGGTAAVTYETVAVARGTVIESVTATGQIKPEQYASLRFKAAGAIARMNVDVGDTVYTGQVLAALDTSDLSKRLTQAEADLIAANVSLANAEQEVLDQQTRGGQSVSVLYSNAPNTLNDILNLVQQVYASFSTFYDSTGHLTSAVASPILISQRVVDADSAKGAGDVAIKALVGVLENFSATASSTQVDSTLIAIHAPLQQLQSSLSALINAVASIPSGSVTATTLAAYKDTLALARTNMNSAISKESTLASNLRDTGVQNTLALNTALANKRSAGANVEKAKAALEIAKQSLSDAYLRAPMNGTIAVKSKQLGELVTSADQVYYMLGQGGFEVVANIPEVDVSRIRVGSDVEGTLDAFSATEKFTLTTQSIDPDQTTIDGVVYYKTHFVFKVADARFRPGMSVNLTMIANQKDNVLVVPRRAVTQRGAVSSVRIAPAVATATPEVREVTLGLRGDMQVEIVSGLSEGETVVVAEKK
jgi:RND family efflux transporter MFP subunit